MARNINHGKVGRLLEQAKTALALDEAGVDRLSEEDVKKFLRLSKDEINVLNAIASGRPPRNSQSILAAIRLKLEHTVTPPAAKNSGLNPVTVVVKTMNEIPRPQTPPPPPEPQDLVEDETVQ